MVYLSEQKKKKKCVDYRRCETEVTQTQQLYRVWRSSLQKYAPPKDSFSYYRRSERLTLTIEIPQRAKTLYGHIYTLLYLRSFNWICTLVCIINSVDIYRSHGLWRFCCRSDQLKSLPFAILLVVSSFYQWYTVSNGWACMKLCFRSVRRLELAIRHYVLSNSAQCIRYAAKQQTSIPNSFK